MSSIEHVLALPIQMSRASVGGLTSAVLHECVNAPFEFKIFSPDLGPLKIGNAQVVPVSNGIPVGDIDVANRQYVCGAWQLLHPEAYLPPALPPDISAEMYSASQTRVESVDDLISFLEERMEQGLMKERAVNMRWKDPLSKLKAPSVVHWQEFGFIPAILEYGPDLKRRGCQQTFHLHDALPDSLPRSTWGRSLLEALSIVDKVFLHTDSYCATLKTQLEELGLRVPQIRRYDLGIDTGRLQRSLDRLVTDEPLESFPGWTELSESQRKVALEIFESRDTIPHRFVCFDRVDPIKAPILTYRAIEQFLDAKISEHISLTELSTQYRFYLFHETNPQLPEVQPHELNLRYAQLAARELRNLCSKFPGIVYALSPFGGDAREILPALVAGCHSISGSAQEGLNLAAMEAAWINTRPNIDADCTIIIGGNAGFSLQVARHGNQDLAFFPKSGSVSELAQAIESVVDQKLKSPGILRANLERLVAAEVEPRGSSLLEY